MYKDKTFLRFLLCCFVTSVAILITSLCPVFAQTINVGVQMAFTNIQDAIENAIDGDTVVVGDGSYTENVIIDKPITLKSKNGYESTFIASENNSDIIRITADNVIFEGFSIHSAGSDKKIIALDSVNNCIITNNKIGVDEQNKDSICIYLKNSTLNTISNNSCKFAKYGIYLDSSDMNQIIGNICSNNNVNGIYIYSSKKCIVVDNQYFENNYHGISISSSESIQLNKNDCQKNTMNGIGVFSSKYCQIFNNDSSQNIENGVYLYKSQQNVIFNNTLCSNTISGIKLNSSEDNTFYANSLCDNEEYGIILENAERGPYFIDFSLNNHFYLNTLNNNLNGHIYSANTSSDIIKKPNIWHTPAKILYEFNNELFRNYIGNYYNLTSDQVDSDQNGIADQKFIFPNHEKPDPFPLVKSTDNYSVKGLWFSNDSYLHRWETFVSRETVEIKKDSSYVWFIQNSTDNDLILLKNAVWSGRLQFENNLPNGAEFFIEIGSSPDAIGFSNSGPNAFVTNKDYFYDNNNKVIVFETNSRSLKKENLSDYIAIKITSNVDCKIVTGNGGSFISLPYYHEISPPTVLDVKPAIGSIHGGTLVTIFGSGFGEFQISGKILFGSVEATSYELWSSTRIICRAPSHHYGAKDISLINDSGQKDKLKNSFLFYEDTIIVGQSEDIQQIQKAINMSKKDDTIIVKDGIYEEFIEIKKDNITLKSENGYENTTIITKTSDLPVIDITADYVTIEGFTVYGATESAGINLALNAAHCFISKNRCGIDNDHSNKTGIFIGLYSFWSFGHVYDNIVFQNICIGNDTGISFECSKYNTVTGNQCFSNNTGIYVKGIDDGLTVLSEINTVSFNTCNQNNENGIVVESSVNNMILYNVCKQNNKNGIFIQNAKKNTFFKNELSENEEFGMKTIENSQNNIIYANGFSENINGHVYSDHVSSNQWISSIPVLYQFENGFNKGFMGNYFQENQSIDSNNDGISEALFEIPEFKIMDHFALYKEINCYNIDSWFMTSDGKMYTTNNMIYPETVVINPGSSYMWTSESFSQNQSFSGLDFWSGQLVFENELDEGFTFKIEIGSTVDGIQFIQGGPEFSQNNSHNQQYFYFQTKTSEFQVPENSRLAFRLTNMGLSNHHVVTGSSWTYISPPSNKPVTPIITSFTPPNISADSTNQITINGSNFGIEKGRVVFDGVQALSYLKWSPTQIVCIPPVLDNGFVDLKVFTSKSQSSKPSKIQYGAVLVGPNEKYQTIQSAIDQENEHTTILVKDGQYSENLVISRPITIKSENGYSTTTIMAADSSKAVISVYSDKVLIKGFTVYGANSYNTAGLYVGTNGNNCIIMNNRIGMDSDKKNRYGLLLDGVSNCKIENNLVAFNTYDGIKIEEYAAKNNIVYHNIIHSNKGNGILLNHSSQNQIIDNTCYSNSEGVYLNSDSNNNIIKKNVFRLNQATGMYIYGDNNFVADNQCYLNKEDGLYIQSSGSLLVNNVFHTNDRYGINISSASDNSFFLNSLKNNVKGNIQSQSSDNNTFHSPTHIHYIYNHEPQQNPLGNYYDDHNQEDQNNDGILDNPVSIDGVEISDLYPLANSTDQYILNGWWLFDDGKMYLNNVSNSKQYFRLEEHSQNIWISAEQTDVDMYYSENDVWSGQLSFLDSPRNNSNFFIEIGYSTNGNDFFNCGIGAKITGDGNNRFFSFTGSNHSFVIPEGKYLALRIHNQNDTAYNLLTGSTWSYLTVSDDNVLYDSPELWAFSEMIEMPVSKGISTLRIANIGTGDLFWEVESNNDWISIKEDFSGHNSGLISIECTPNTGEQRTGYITINTSQADSKSIQIIQAGIPPAQRIYVPENYSDIQPAIDAASDGAIITVQDGTYLENIVINKPVTLCSANGYSSTIIQSTDSNVHAIKINSDKVVLDGFSIYGTTNGWNKSAIYLDYANNCIIQNNQIVGYEEQSSSRNGYGIELYYSNNVIISNNSVSNHDNGINIKGDLNLIINNKISLSHNIGINIDERYYNVIDNNLCELNKIGLQLSYSNMNTVHSNELLHNSDTGLMIQSSNQNAILNNTISSNDINGLSSIGSVGNHIYLNRIEGIQNNISSDTNSNNYWHSPTELNYTFQKVACKSLMGNYYHGITMNDIDQDGISEMPSQPSPYDKMDDYPLVFDKNQYQTNTLIFSNTGKIVSVSDLMGRPGITTLTCCESYVFLSKDPLLLTKIYSEKDHWSGQITFEKSPGTGDKFLVEIGCSENGIDFIHSGAEATIHCESDINQYQFISNNNAFIIKKGHYLAIRMKHIRKGGVFYSTYQYKMLTGSLLSYVVEPVPVDHPSIFSVHPMSCPAEGNQMITIKGTRFGEKPGKVLFGDVPAEKIIQWSINSIECMVPAYSQGLVDIAVIKDNNSAAAKKNHFVYIDHKTLYTGVNESFQTIQSAINAASSGMTVVVRDGLYVENIFVDKELTIISENGYTSCIIESSNSDLDVIEIRHSNVIFKGFSILGNNNPSGIHIGNGIQYCQIINNKCGQNGEVKIGTGIKLSSATKNTLIGNKCLNSSGNGILLEYESNNNEIINNECTMNRYGIYVSDCHKILFVSNICSENKWYGLYMCDSADNVLESNICTNNDSNGIKLERISNSIFWGNIVRNNHDNGFSIVSSESNTIFFNSFSNNGKNDIFTDIQSKNTWYSSAMVYYTYKGEYSNICFTGNYYGDHDFYDNNADGIADKNYLITETGLKDKYPLSSEINDYSIQSWYLQNDKQFVISQTTEDESSININRGVSILFPIDYGQYQKYSDPAFCSGIICFSQVLNKDTFFFLESGFLNENNDFRPTSEPATIQGSGMNNQISFTINYSHFQYNEEEKFALRITNPNKYDYSIQIGTGNTFISSPGQHKTSIITEISPSSAFIKGGTQLVIKGTGFGNEPGQILFDDLSLDASLVLQWSDYQIICLSPEVDNPKNAMLTINNGRPEIFLFYDNDINVGNTGTFQSIQSAINAMNNGETIIVEPGNYTENIIITKPIVLKARNKNQSAIISKESNNHVVYVSSDHVTIDGFKIYGGNAGIFMDNNAQYCIIKNNTCGDKFIPNESGIFLSQAKYNYLLNNTCSWNKDYGISFNSNSDSNKLIGNFVENNKSGIDFYSSDHNILVNNTIKLNLDYNLEVKYSDQNTFYLNAFIQDSVQKNINSNSQSNWSSPVALAYRYECGLIQKSPLGNYYSYNRGEDLDHNGIFDVQYDINTSEVDNYPLFNSIQSYNITGDMNHDGRIDLKDAVIGLKVLSTIWNEDFICCIDFDCNIKTGIEEIIYIMERFSKQNIH